MNWIETGKPRLIGKHRSKALVVQQFRKRTSAERRDYGLFSSKNASVVLPITRRGEVVAVKQYRFGSGKIQTELPSGVLNDKESGVKAARRELKEETGYVPGRLFKLGLKRGLFIDPPAFLSLHFFFLALDCVKVGEPQLDPEEEISVKLIPFKSWLQMCFRGQIDDQTSLTATFLALPHLQKFGPRISSKNLRP